MEILKTTAAAAYLAISEWKLRKLCHEGKIPYISDGDNTSAFRFLISDLDDYISRCRIPATAK